MFLLLLACASTAPEPPSEGARPAAEGPAAERPAAEHSAAPPSSLARSLYALGPEAQELRTLLWMRELALDPPQTQALCAHSAQAQALWQAHEGELQALKTQRAEALAPTLAPLKAQLLEGPLRPEQAQTHAQALDELALPDPLALRSQCVRQTLALSESLWPALSAEQQAQMGTALFLMRPLDAGARSTPPALPEPWRDGDFSTLRRSTPSADPSISALFALEDGDPVQTLSTTDRKILLALLLVQPGTQAACQSLTPPPATP